MTEKYTAQVREPDGTWKTVTDDKPLEIPAFVTLREARLEEKPPILLRLRQWWRQRWERSKASNVVDPANFSESSGLAESVFDRTEFFLTNDGTDLPNSRTHPVDPDQAYSNSLETKLSRRVLESYKKTDE